MFNSYREEAQEEREMPEAKSPLPKCPRFPEHSKLPAEGLHSIMTVHSRPYHQPLSSENIYPTVLSIIIIFNSNNSEGNGDSINWVGDRKVLFEKPITFNWNNHKNISLKLPSHCINKNHYSYDFPLGERKQITAPG